MTTVASANWASLASPRSTVAAVVDAGGRDPPSGRLDELWVVLDSHRPAAVPGGGCGDDTPVSGAEIDHDVVAGDTDVLEQRLEQRVGGRQERTETRTMPRPQPEPFGEQPADAHGRVGPPRPGRQLHQMPVAGGRRERPFGGAAVAPRPPPEAHHGGQPVGATRRDLVARPAERFECARAPPLPWLVAERPEGFDRRLTGVGVGHEERDRVVLAVGHRLDAVDLDAGGVEHRSETVDLDGEFLSDPVTCLDRREREPALGGVVDQG